MLPGDRQRRLAGNEDRGLRASGKQAGNSLGRTEELLEVIQNQQQPRSVRERLDELVLVCLVGLERQVQRLPDRQEDQFSLTNGGQRHVDDVPPELVDHGCRDVNHQAGFAHPARPGDRDQAFGRIVDQCQYPVQVSLPSQHRRQARRYGGGWNPRGSW